MGPRSYHTVSNLTSLAAAGAAAFLGVCASGCADFFLSALDEAPNEFGVTRPPLANAGADREVLLGLRIQLHGSGSYHPDRTSFTARWTQIAGDPDETGDLVIRERGDRSERVDAGDEERFRLEDVANPGDDPLIQQRVADGVVTMCAKPCPRVVRIE